MDAVVPDKALQKLELLRQANKLSSALCEFMTTNIPELPDSDDSDLIFFTERYVAAMTRLKVLSDRVDELNAEDNITPETEPQCEALRRTTRENLTLIAEKYTICKSIVEERKTRYQQELINARKKQNLSAYLHSSLIGRTGYSYDTTK